MFIRILIFFSIVGSGFASFAEKASILNAMKTTLLCEASDSSVLLPEECKVILGSLYSRNAIELCRLHQSKRLLKECLLLTANLPVDYRTTVICQSGVPLDSLNDCIRKQISRY